MKIKQNAYLKKHYNLTVEDTKKLIDYCLVKMYPDINFTMRVSDNSNSIYVVVEYLGSKIYARISDHENTKYKYTLIVSDGTTNYHVANFIKHTINILMKYRLYKFLDANSNNKNNL